MKNYAYVHIEKCAGTSLHKILEYNDSRYWVLNPKVFHTNGKEYPLQKEDTNKIFKSYFVNGIGGHAIRPYRLDAQNISSAFTFLRNPSERYVSHYLHQFSKMNLVRTFEEYLQEDYYHNFITKALSLNGDVVEAKNVLDKMAYVGDMKTFNQSLLELNATVFNNRLSMYKKHDMKGVSSKKANKIILQFKEDIHNNNQKDWELYDYISSEAFRSKFNVGIEDVKYLEVSKMLDFKRKVFRVIKNKTWSYL
ncbi:sulfotransferase family 2 domain-containing protein [Winogradskyella sp. MH6]|uniref:sulfotransferase family 2 domain-containing protein n=1 Tax=Winogradskyella sp. MH6 TaxID=2929510 RepID=UPI001FB50EA2|nr:sulfotransferase family 2 domain-containing protein [Winogradskyella sp. MH6]